MKIIELWRVVDKNGAYYTLKDSKGRTIDLMKFGICGDLEINERVIVKKENGIRTIEKRVPNHSSAKEIHELIESV